MSEGQRAAIENMTEEGDIYNRLANSIAPGAGHMARGHACRRGLEAWFAELDRNKESIPRSACVVWVVV